jgi:hypothetical protein
MLMEIGCIRNQDISLGTRDTFIIYLLASLSATSLSHIFVPMVVAGCVDRTL